MCSLIERLRQIFGLDGDSRELLGLEWSKGKRRRVCRNLHGTLLCTNHLGDRNKIVTFGGLSRYTADRQHAYGGYLGITVQQHMYCRHRRRLDYERLPCVKVRVGKTHVDYFPIECLDLIDKCE